MSASLSLVTVTHRSSRCLPRLLASARREAAANGLALETIAVDHSEDDAEVERLRAAAADRLIVAPNRGYAAGVNRGIAAASGDLLLVANPDVELQQGSLAALLDAVGRDDGVVGPLFVLGGLEFPPADGQRPGEQVRRWLAVRSRRLWRRHMAREVEAWRRVWEGAGPVPVGNLSGALLLFPRSLSARVGPWDERFFLYFEETDWLARARGAGARVVQVPRARAVHEWAHAAHPAAHGETFLRSRREFLRKRYSLAGAALARLVPRRCPFVPTPWEGAGPVMDGADRWLWLLSPSLLGFPAARVGGGRSEVPAALALLRQRLGGEQPALVLAYDAAKRRIAGAWLSR